MSEKPRLLSPQKREDDTEASIRPLSLLDFTGQEAARKNLRVFIEAAKARNEALSRCLYVEDAGDTDLPVGGLVPKEEVKEANALAKDKGGKEAKTRKPKAATYKTLLLGITKASLQSESFLSGASFQETTKVLTEAALAGATDELRGLKENVILGHLIPAGTGCDQYQAIRVAKLVDVPEGDETSDEAYLAEARDEAEELGAESPEFASTISQETLAGLSEALRAGAGAETEEETAD